MTDGPLVYVIDDDASFRRAVSRLLRSAGLAVETLASAEEFLESDSIARTQCLILDVAMPGMSGPELQRELRQRDHRIPSVFITAHRDDPLRPRLIEQGAVDCLFKPFSETALIEALTVALRLN